MPITLDQVGKQRKPYTARLLEVLDSLPDGNLYEWLEICSAAGKSETQCRRAIQDLGEEIGRYRAKADKPTRYWYGSPQTIEKLRLKRGQ